MLAPSVLFIATPISIRVCVSQKPPPARHHPCLGPTKATDAASSSQDHVCAWMTSIVGLDVGDRRGRAAGLRAVAFADFV
jgi:hypothetical protein